MKGLNLAGFAKIKEDKDNVHMKHKDGHVIILASRALPKIQREQLKRLPMAEGGSVPTPPPIDKDKAKQVADSFKKSLGFDEGGKVGTSSNDPKPQEQSPVNINVNPSPSATPQTVPVVQQTAPVNTNPQVPANTNLLNQDQTLNAPQAVGLQQKAAREQQAIDAAKGAAAADIEKGYIDQKQQQQQKIQQNYDELKNHTNEFKSYITANPINPNHYQESMSTGNKVANAFGLLFGGFKQGFSGGSNPAMDYLNGQIQRDIEAQRSRGEQQKTILGAYENLYGQGVIANNLATASMNDIYAHKGQMLAAQLGTPQAKATADAFAAQKAIENNQLLLDTAGRLGQLNAGGGPSENNKLPSGIQRASAMLQKHVNPEEEYANTPILNSDAEKQLNTLRYTPKAKEEIDQIKSQYTQAQQADAILNQLHGVHQQMAKDAKESGGFFGSGYLRRHDPTANIPFAGPLIAGVTSRPLTDTQANRSYELNKTRVVSDIANALKGTNVGGEEIQRIVDANSPEVGDTPEMIANKEKAIRIFIKNSVPKSLLKDWKLSK